MLLNNVPLLLLTSTSVATALIVPSIEERTPKPQSILKALAGTYALVNTTSTLNFVPIPDATYGEKPVGILTYSASGYMSATLTATETELRPNVTFPFQVNDTDSDWALVGKHSIGYAGPFRINPDLPANATQGQLFHGPLTVANVPTMVGQEQRRNYTVVSRWEAGKQVKYLRIGSERGRGYRGELWWKRLD